MRNKLQLVLLLAALSATGALGVGTQFWTASTYEDFQRGSFSDISLSREGALQLSPALEEAFNTDQAMIWGVARDSRGNLFLGTGHSGRVFRLGPNGSGALFFDAAEPEVFALAVDSAGNVYVGTSPDGKVYKVDSAGASTEFFTPQAKYIWSLAFGPDGLLYVGTGDRGRIYRVRPNGEGEIFYETQQSHVMSLAAGPGGDLLAGTEPNGLLYRISSAGRGFVIYDAPQSEIHSILTTADGSIYASAMSSADDGRIRVGGGGGGGQAPVRATTTITVRADDSPFPGPGGGGDGGGQQDQQGQAQVTVQAQPVVVAGGGGGGGGQGRGPRSALYRVGTDSTVETLWNSPRESIFDVLASERSVLFSTDEQGRIYELTPDRQVSLLTQTGQGQTTRLIASGDFIMATTANVGKVFRLGTRPAASGFFESEVRDAGTISGWGQIRWTADLPPGTALELFTRSGNSSRPDSTWSEWSSGYRQAAGEQISSPAARYVQWKAVLRSAADRSPVLREVIVAYLPRNRSPEISEIRVAPRAERGGGGGGNVVVNAGGGGAQRGFPGAGAQRPQPPRGMDIRWTANDPDQDELSYALYFRGEEESEWKLLQAEVKGNLFALENDTLPDGRYRIKVVSSDSGSNPDQTARTAERISAPFLVDGTPPLVEVVETTRARDSATARFRARDGASVLTRAEYAVDADPLKPILSEDRIVDSNDETFRVTATPLDSREHLLTIRVYDAAGNIGVGKAVWPASGDAGGR